MNKLSKTNIEWVKNPDGSKGYVWNPAHGCLNNCPYCYARRFAQRFGKTEDERAFLPTWKQGNFEKSFPKKPSRIFVDSMSDIAFWKHSWIRKVFDKIFLNLSHEFLFLTKKPAIYLEYSFPLNSSLGITATNNFEAKRAQMVFKRIGRSYIKFISIEPILEYIDPEKIDLDCDWVIVGKETGNQKNKIVPQKDWIIELYSYCRDQIPLFMKNNIQSVWRENLIQEFPEVNGI